MPINFTFRQRVDSRRCLLRCRTIQACPKDLLAALEQAERERDQPAPLSTCFEVLGAVGAERTSNPTWLWDEESQPLSKSKQST